MASVTELMSLTFEMRRNDIMNNVRSVHDIIKDFPFLPDKDQVTKIPDPYNLYIPSITYQQMILEMERILRKKDILRNGVTRWKKMLPKIFEEAKCCKKEEARKISKEILSKRSEEWHGQFSVIQLVFS